MRLKESANAFIHTYFTMYTYMICCQHCIAIKMSMQILKIKLKQTLGAQMKELLLTVVTYTQCSYSHSHSFPLCPISSTLVMFSNNVTISFCHFKLAFMCF